MMNRVLLSFVILYFILSVNGDCPKGCDCLPDPLNPLLHLLVCRWTPTVNSPRLTNLSHVRSIHLFCENYALSNDLLYTTDMLHQLKIEGCRLPDPQEFFKNLEHLRSLELMGVTNNMVSLILPEGVFNPLKRLENLKISSCSLQRLPTDIFCSLKNLQVFNVSTNALTSIKTEANCISKVIIADFSHNKIEKISDHLKNFPSVRQIFFADNLLSTISENALTSVVHLQHLDLQNNKIDTIDSLPVSLIHINLAWNRLGVLPKALAQLPSLISFNLSHNSIDESSPSVLATTLLETLDLSWNRFKLLPTRLIPASLVSLVHLNLDSNQISEIKSRELQNLTKLQTLSLASNRLRILRDETFYGLQFLSLLRLCNNSLDTIEPAVFADLAIDEMDLSHNKFTETPIALSRLYKLKKIDMSHNRISKMYQFNFKQIPNLQIIDLSYNELQSVPQYVFTDCSSLTSLNVSHNQIQLLYKDSFSKCTKLRRLDISYNRLESIDDALSQAPEVKRLDLSHNKMTILQWESLPAKLETLNVDDNHLTLLGAGYSSKVKTASIKNNRISQLSADQVPASLEQLDLSFNKIQHIAPGTFGSKTTLKKLNLYGNELKILARDGLEVVDAIHGLEVDLRENPLLCSCELDWIRKDELRVFFVEIEKTYCLHSLNKKKLSLTEITASDLLCPYEKICEPDCVCCQYGNCDCKAVCPMGCSCYRDADYTHNIVRCIALNETNMKAFTPSDVPMSATHVYLSGLNLKILRPHSFLGRNKLQHLHLNGSRIKQIQPKAFNTLTKLKLLDLSDNSIDSLTGDEFLKTTAISHLFLNGNELSTVEKSLIDRLPNLQIVTLHKNRFTNISSALASSSIVSVSLSGNPFRCDCSDIHTAPSWIHENRQKVVDVEKIFCVENVTKAFQENDTTILSVYPPNIGHDIFTMPMDEFLRDYNRSICIPLTHGFFGQEPTNSILMFVFFAACFFLIVAMILLGVSFARRTHTALNQRRYKASSSLNCSSSPGSSPLPLPLISFDAFVSYSRCDEKMVVEDICRKLEQDFDYNLCLLHRDGPIYNNRLHAVSDELISQMDASQSLILVLTRSFLENEWRTLQIKTSHLLFAKNRNKRLVAIFVDDGVNQNLLDDELGQILRKNTILRMSDPLFWTLLKSALPARHSPPPSNSSEIYSDMYGIVPSALV